MMTEQASNDLRARGNWNPAEPDSIECLQIVYKVAERCNINCTYCYYFNMGEDTALSRPARASVRLTEQLGDWLAHGCAELGVTRVKIAFHGGEPMLVQPAVFDKMCATLRRKVAPVAHITFSIQTNGTILNQHWVDLFRQHEVTVGVSVDGKREAHDRHRLDHAGRSTFAVTEATIRTLVDSAAGDPARLPSTISVMDHRVDYHESYTYFRELGVESMGFLLPDRNADDTEFRASGHAAKYGDRMFELFESWLAEDNPRIRIRFIDNALRHFLVGVAPGPVVRPRKDVQVLIARSDGTVTVDDSYIPALEWYSSTAVHPIASSTVREVLSDPIFLEIESLSHELPEACRSCRWRTICRGGDLENRYTRQTGFNNPSIYCDSYKVFYAKMCDLLRQNGYPAEEIARRFGDNSDNVLP
ncbi:Anaerobic sulfatase-maturating enzyme [Enhygromyxa salina]|uniref:Anaerobic sulfatase-maturating enzyme n=1 Tax=Enhygromyxa salina TaxID=215803 RepID=A0A2S9XSL1_9BACT|nr:radical SAM protein [Enhygromyxa salina]PRP95852.1 Anaerobic sulfatase-maturating enzyme [Enhygromyxa salina]